MTKAGVPRPDAARPDDGGRFATLDGLRGIAVMAILLMNVGDFALPQEAYLHPLLGGGGVGDRIVWAVSFVLADGKWRNLFSLLFGASMLLVADRAAASGRSGAAVHYRRMAWLLVIGLAHFYLLWWGDILHHYALVGAVAFLLRDRPPHALVALGIVILGLDALLLGNAAAGLWQARALAEAPGAAAATIAQWRASGLAGPPDAALLAREVALYRGDYAAILGDRLGPQAGLPITELFAAGPETLALMLFGMAALRSGFVTGAWPRRAYLRTAAIAYAIGLPAMAALAGWCWWSGFDPLVCFTALFPAALVVRAPLMLGNAALLVLWLRRPPGRMAGAVIAAGRMALSNYLLSSLLMTWLFYGYGAGRFATMGRAALLAPVAAAWAIMLSWSGPWLRRHRHGPAEWLWRSLARWEFQPLAR